MSKFAAKKLYFRFFENWILRGDFEHFFTKGLKRGKKHVFLAVFRSKNVDIQEMFEDGQSKGHGDAIFEL